MDTKDLLENEQTFRSNESYNVNLRNMDGDLIESSSKVVVDSKNITLNYSIKILYNSPQLIDLISYIVQGNNT